MKAQMVDDDESNQAVMKQAAIILLTFESLRHLVKTMQEVMWHIQRIAHEIHQ
jgi:hypothetical protein